MDPAVDLARKRSSCNVHLCHIVTFTHNFIFEETWGLTSNGCHVFWKGLVDLRDDGYGGIASQGATCHRVAVCCGEGVSLLPDCAQVEMFGLLCVGCFRHRCDMEPTAIATIPNV
jgi:hypothetical protein